MTKDNVGKAAELLAQLSGRGCYLWYLLAAGL